VPSLDANHRQQTVETPIAERATLFLEAIIEPGDRVTIEGDNQKQADFLASALAKVDPARISSHNPIAPEEVVGEISRFPINAQ
jgi:hypothetical protein